MAGPCNLFAGISYAVDILAYAVLLHLFWPSRSVLFMVNGERPLPMYDLEITGEIKVRKEGFVTVHFAYQIISMQ